MKKRGKYIRFNADNPKPTECSLDWCSNKYYAKGLCRYHYARKLEGKPLEKYVPQSAKPCAFDGCKYQGFSGGLCRSHYMNKREGKELKPLQTRTRWFEQDPEGRVCKTCGELKPWSEYYIYHHRNRPQGGKQYFTECKPCVRAAQNLRMARKRGLLEDEGN